jgi:hypothetical protein
MDVNAIGMPTNRPLLEQPSAPAEVSVAKNYDGAASELAKVNTAKSALPEGVGSKVDKTA